MFIVAKLMFGANNMALDWRPLFVWSTVCLSTCIALRVDCEGWARGCRNERYWVPPHGDRSSGGARPTPRRGRRPRRSWLVACRAGDFHGAHARGRLKPARGPRYRGRRRHRRRSSPGKIRSRGDDPTHSSRTNHNQHAVFFLHSVCNQLLLHRLHFITIGPRGYRPIRRCAQLKVREGIDR